MIKKILIANRGEIALRIVRACRELGIHSLAVYSEADEQSLHVQLADEAICIGPASGSDSYLRTDRILSAAEIGDIDAIHPGYGFLSENAEFVEQCESCNIQFIGPKAETIKKMGDKSMARETVSKVGVPIIPGSDGPLANEIEATKVAQKIGFPVIIKAVSGGGGRGMRIAHNAVTFAKEFLSAKMEAEKAFGDGSLYVEKYLENPRHIEFQILADKHGNMVHLGERDCSVQRRHQKVIEEAPSPFLDKSLRNRMGKAALKAAEAADYVNAGTIEFLVDAKGNYYFIEMNTRIQVEHPITEQVIDFDLIREQISVAAKIPISGKHYLPKLHSIECRINAEDPYNDFRPSPGKITNLNIPGGHGIRLDTHVYSGYTIPPFYDSMIAKLITTAQTREEAINKMKRALQEFVIEGIKTTIPFHLQLMDHPDYLAGNYTTKFMEEFEMK